jgi:phage/plasmid-like protein (TIGR03299 family)
MLTKLVGVKTADEALQKCGLAWGIRESPVYDGAGKLIPTHKALFRTDNGAQLSVVKKTYQWIDNSVFGFFDAVCKKQKAEYISGGSLDGGKRVFLQASIGRMEIVPGDLVEATVLLSNSFTSESSLLAIIGSLRIWCANQLRLAANKSLANISIRHTSGIQDRTLEAFRLFNLSTTSFGLFVNKAKLLAHKAINDKQLKVFLDTLAPDTGTTQSKNSRNRIVELSHSGLGQKGDLTGWSILNGYTQHLDHDGGGDQDSLISSRLFGFRASQKSKALDLALAL